MTTWIDPANELPAVGQQVLVFVGATEPNDPLSAAYPFVTVAEYEAEYGFTHEDGTIEYEGSGEKVLCWAAIPEIPDQFRKESLSKSV